jgi:F0F1-type ATP synthase epsilon subunit
LNIESGSVKVIAETLELAREIDVSRAREAQMKAEQMLNDAALDSSSFRKYQLKLERALIRQSIGGA